MVKHSPNGKPTKGVIVTRDEAFKDVFYAAIEGGVNYWAAVTDYDVDDARVVLSDIEDEDGERWEVTTATVGKGIETIVAGGAEVNREILRQASLIHHGHYDLADVDAWVADVVVQVGLFGEIVFG